MVLWSLLFYAYLYPFPVFRFFFRLFRCEYNSTTDLPDSTDNYTSCLRTLWTPRTIRSIRAIRVRFSSERNYHNYYNYPRNNTLTFFLSQKSQKSFPFFCFFSVSSVINKRCLLFYYLILCFRFFGFIRISQISTMRTVSEEG